MTEIEQLRQQVTDLAARVAELEKKFDPAAFMASVISAPIPANSAVAAGSIVVHPAGVTLP